MTIQNVTASAVDVFDQTSWTTIDTMTITPGAGTFLAVFTGETTQNTSPSSNELHVAIFVDGVEQTHTFRAIYGDSSLPSNQQPVATSCLVTPTAGQVVDVRYKQTAGNAMFITFRELTLLPAEQTTYQDSATGDVTINSATWATLGSMTRTPASGDYLVVFTASEETPSDDVAGFRLSVGGTPVPHTVRRVECELSVQDSPYDVMIAASISPNGSQVVEIEWQKNAGTGPVTCHQRSMTLIEVNSGDIFQATGTADDTDSTTR
ncbi:hypothetical protein LCGC14_2067860 [marine sediment metagenome]|uniref:Uncharacterized protein n=1 Tax=marine sediment metagenome TaxID=412755 RepID=A0A0F9GXR7_9ZZZZ